MYTPAQFLEIDPAVIADVMAGAPLACVVAMTDLGMVANHLPLLPAPNGDLIGHVALANDLHRNVADGAEVMAIFKGEDGYITPNSYPSKQDHHRHVPTWNYQAVHIHGTITFQHDERAKRTAVALLTRLHERRVNGAEAWKMTDAPAEYIEQMLAAIVAFKITPTRVMAKSKLGQNREPRDLAGAIEVLRARGENALADAMESAAKPS